MKEKQVKAESFKAASADPRFDLSLLAGKEDIIAKKAGGSHKIPIRAEKDMGDEDGVKLKKKKKKAKILLTAEVEHPTAKSLSHGLASLSSSMAPSKKPTFAGIALSSALKSELSGGSSKKRTTTYVHASDEEEGEDAAVLAQNTVMPGTKLKKVKGPAPISEEVLEAARKLSKTQRRKLESIEKRKELEARVSDDFYSRQKNVALGE